MMAELIILLQTLGCLAVIVLIVGMVKLIGWLLNW